MVVADILTVTSPIGTGESCPECGSMLVEKNTKRFSGVVCSNQECDYKKTKEE